MFTTTVMASNNIMVTSLTSTSSLAHVSDSVLSLHHPQQCLPLVNFTIHNNALPLVNFTIHNNALPLVNFTIHNNALPLVNFTKRSFSNPLLPGEEDLRVSILVGHVLQVRRGHAMVRGRHNMQGHTATTY